MDERTRSMGYVVEGSVVRRVNEAPARRVSPEMTIRARVVLHHLTGRLHLISNIQYLLLHLYAL